MRIDDLKRWNVENMGENIIIDENDEKYAQYVKIFCGDEVLSRNWYLKDELWYLTEEGKMV